MSELVERLRDSAALPNGLYAEAADRIEALEKALKPFVHTCSSNKMTSLTVESDDIKRARQALKDTA